MRLVVLAVLLLCLIFSKINSATIPEVAEKLDAPLWDSATVPLFADFGDHGELFTDHQYAFAASHYKIISLEKCLGYPKYKTEEAFTIAAQQFKKHGAAKILFYWNAQISIAHCYNASNEFAQHPRWWFRNDRGQVVTSGGFTVFDTTNPEVRQYWIGVALNVRNMAGTTMDGVFVDGSSATDWTSHGVSPARTNAWNAGLAQMVADLTTIMHRRHPGSIVIGNGLSYAPYPPDHGMSQLNYLDGVWIEHWGSFEDINDNTATVNGVHMLNWMKMIEEASSKGKMVMVKAWPGPSTYPPTSTGPSWPAAWGQPRPTTYPGLASAAADLINWPLAAFLCMMQPNTYFSYSWWYSIYDGYVPCPNDPNTCSCPANWYPDLAKPLGAAKGNPILHGMVCQREYEHATLHVDLSQLRSGSIAWH